MVSRKKHKVENEERRNDLIEFRHLRPLRNSQRTSAEPF